MVVSPETRVETAATPPRPFASGPERIFDVKQPLFEPGEQVARDQVQSLLGYDVTIPSWLPEGVSDSQPEYWAAELTSEAGIRYSGGLVVLYRPWLDKRTPDQTYTDQAESWGAGEVVKLASGASAWVVERSKVSPISTLSFDRDGIELRLFAMLPADTLIRVAGSVPG